MRISLLVFSILFFSVSLQARMLTCKTLIEGHEDSSFKPEKLEGFDYNSAIKSLISFSQSEKLWDDHKSEHALEDLEGALELIKSKKDHESFDALLKKWESFYRKIKGRIDEYQTYDEDKKKKWKESLEVYLSFSIGQFITFVETSKKEVYQVNSSILDHLNSLENDSSLEIWLFEVEKQVRRFFSVNEFKKCKF